MESTFQSFAARIGNVIYWLANTVALAIVAISIFNLVSAGDLRISVLGLIAAGLTYVAGRLLRYVLRGS